MGAVAATKLAEAKRQRARHVRTWLRSASRHFVLVACSAIVLLPVLFMVSTSFKPQSEAYQIPPSLIPRTFILTNYGDALFKYFQFGLFTANTLIITVGVLAGRLLSSSLVAFGFARIRFVGRNLLFILVLSTLMVPHQVTIVPLFILFKQLGWLNTFLPLIVPAWFGGGAFYIFLLRQFIMTISPELDNAARIDGCGWLGIYTRIILPLIKPALVTVAIFSSLQTWNDFFDPVIFLRKVELFTLAVGLQFITNSATTETRPVITVVMAASTLIMLPPVLLFLFAQRYFIQGIVVSGIKG